MTPDSKRIISGAENGEVFIWEYDSDKPIFRLDKHSYEIKKVYITADGNTGISICRGRRICIWDLKNNIMVNTFSIYGRSGLFTMTPDGKYGIFGNIYPMVHTIGYGLFPLGNISWSIGYGNRFKADYDNTWILVIFGTDHSGIIDNSLFYWSQDWFVTSILLFIWILCCAYRFFCCGFCCLVYR